MKPYEKICEEDPRGQEEAECHKYPKCEGCPRAEEFQTMKRRGLVVEIDNVFQWSDAPLVHWKV